MGQLETHFQFVLSRYKFLLVLFDVVGQSAQHLITSSNANVLFGQLISQYLVALLP